MNALSPELNMKLTVPKSTTSPPEIQADERNSFPIVSPDQGRSADSTLTGGEQVEALISFHFYKCLLTS